MNSNEYIRGFHWTSKAWYSNVKGIEPVNEISFGFYKDDDTTNGEMKMVWYSLGSDTIPRLECYDDAWGALYSFSDLLAKMAEKDNQSITQDEFVYMLLSCGFKDMTAYKREDVIG